MPRRDWVQLNTTKDQIVPRPRGRKQNFETEPWYAEAARKISAARKSSEQALVEVPAAALAPELTNASIPVLPERR